nr:uncharacterized protein LOC117225000 [Megalopta genalis]
MNIRNIFLTSIMCAHVLVTQSTLRIELDRFEELTEGLTSVLGDCKTLKQNAIGVLTSPQTAIKWTKQSLKSVSLMILDDVEKARQFPRGTFDHNLNTFLITVPSSYRLRRSVQTLRDTSLWNPSALYIIVDDKESKASCRNAYRFLKTMWEEDLLSSTFACVNGESNNYDVYTFNPFASWAPRPWQRVDENEEHRHGGHWTLLSQTFNLGRTTCGDLNFRKTGTLGGHTIRALARDSPPNMYIYPSEKGLAKLDGLDGTIAKMLWRKLNATLRITAIRNVTHYEDYQRLLSKRGHDIFLNNQYIFNKPDAITTYPHLNSGISVLTRQPENETAYEKILKFMNPVFMLAVILVCLATVILLRVFLGRGITEASLEVLRMMLTFSMLRFPRRSAYRIYLLTVFVLFVLTSSTFQSNLSSLLTSPSPSLSVDDTDTLIESRFAIYAYRGYKNALFDDILFSRVKTVDHWDCSEQVITLRNVACVADRSTLLRVAFKKNLHLSQHRIQTLSSAFVVRPDWPLNDRVSSMLLHLSEGGLIDLAWRNTMANYVRKWMTKVDAGKKSYEVMKLEDLAFAFYMLFLGLGAALLAFLVEIGVRSRKGRAGGWNNGSGMLA